MKITKRGTDTKRHTKEYLLGGKWRSRAESVKLVGRGKVPGVAVRRSCGVKYIQSLPGYENLYNLPIAVR
jgi:hypothetical protein